MIVPGSFSTPWGWLGACLYSDILVQPENNHREGEDLLYINENYDIALAMSSSRADPVLGHCPGWGYLNIYISVTALAGGIWIYNYKAIPLTWLGVSLTIKGCVRVSVTQVRSPNHFWFKYPQPVQWHWYRYLNTLSQCRDSDINI